MTGAASGTRERLVEPGGPILSERIGYLPRRQAASGHNPFQDEVREVRVRTDTGKILRIVTNDLDTPALEIAELYKRRWAIELYFRWIKQTLAIRKFVGVSENAIRSQVFIALSALLLMHMAHPSQTAAVSPLEFVRLARAHLMSPRDIADLRTPPARTRHMRGAPVPIAIPPIRIAVEREDGLRRSEVDILRTRRHAN